MLKTLEFEGAYPVLITPMTEDQEIDEKGLIDNIEWYISENTPGICVIGSTGEFASLTKEERLRVAEITVKQVKGRIKCIVGTASESTKETIFYTKHAKDIGADGVLIINSYYCLPNEEEAYQHYKAISDSVDIPIMLYNNPAHSGIDMKPELINRICNLKNIDYVKDATGDLRRVTDMRRLSDGKINIFCGGDDLALENFILGAVGWISVSANIIPRKAQQLYELVKENRLEDAKKLYNEIYPLLDLMENSGKPAQMVKTCLDLMGHSGGPGRLPRLPINDEEKENLLKILNGLGLL